MKVAEQTESPEAEYERRLLARRAAEARFGQADERIANGRLGVFVLAGVVLWLVAVSRVLAPVWLVLPVLAFLALVIIHERVLQQAARAARASAYYENGLKRLRNEWTGTGVTGERFRDPAHPYADDLDVFGSGSLFELLCTARTAAGEEALAAWLRAPADPVTVRARQQAVQDLRPRLDLREDLSVLGADVRGAMDSAALVEWGSTPPRLTSQTARGVAYVLSTLNVAAVAAWALGYGWYALLATGALSLIFTRTLAEPVKEVAHAVTQPSRDLALFSLVLARIEREQFDAPSLRGLRGRLDTDGAPPSQRIARLQGLVGLLESEGNLFFAGIAALLLWRIHLAFELEAWRARSGPDLARWLESTGEFEALCALSGYAYEHPADPFPEVEEGSAFIDGEGLGHPLMSPEQSVRNHVRLGDPLRLLVISGSNMSGKSTLLRTVGTNVVLALAGAPVRARRLRLTPLAIGASLRIHDSLQEGASRFYAEIRRLRQIVDLASGSPPLLFMVDEMLSGTNSHDRRIGAAAVVRALVEQGALGMITTHDLALARIADDLGERAANVHFEDHLEAGVMTFDYQLRPGVVQKSNALALMRAVGLDV